MDTKNTHKVLNDLIKSGKLNNEELEAVANATEHIARLQYNNGEQFDFQGWPLEKMTMKDLRVFMKDNESLSDDVKIWILQDDGMAYGANNGYCNGIYLGDDEDGNDVVEFWF